MRILFQKGFELVVCAALQSTTNQPSFSDVLIYRMNPSDDSSFLGSLASRFDKLRSGRSRNALVNGKLTMWYHFWSCNKKALRTRGRHFCKKNLVSMYFIVQFTQTKTLDCCQYFDILCKYFNNYQLPINFKTICEDTNLLDK